MEGNLKKECREPDANNYAKRDITSREGIVSREDAQKKFEKHERHHDIGNPSLVEEHRLEKMIFFDEMEKRVMKNLNEQNQRKKRSRDEKLRLLDHLYSLINGFPQAINLAGTKSFKTSGVLGDSL